MNSRESFWVEHPRIPIAIANNAASTNADRSLTRSDMSHPFSGSHSGAFREK
jgi:hypothetical protein